MDSGQKKTPSQKSPSARTDDSGFSSSQKAFIRSEITSQLIALKKQIDVELQEDIAKLEKKLLSAVKDAISSSEARQTEEISKVKGDIDAKVATAKNQIVVSNSNQLATVQETTRNMMQVVGQQAANAAYKKVIAEVNRELVPKLNNMVEYVNYQMQDTTELVTDYRRAVHNQASQGTKLLGDGNDKHIISENVSLFFTDNE